MTKWMFTEQREISMMFPCVIIMHGNSRMKQSERQRKCKKISK